MTYLKPSDVKVLYIGTPSIAVAPLLKLIELGFNVVGVVSQEDKEVGRKRILTPPPVKEVALDNHIQVYQPHKIRNDFAWAKSLDLDLILTMAYGQILPDELLKLPRCGSLNLHGSLLPKYRGAAPIQRAIENGEDVTGITLMEMVKEMDAGNIFAKEEVKINKDDTYTSLSEKLSSAAANVVEKYLMDFVNNKLVGQEQDPNQVTFANKILVSEEKLSLELEINSLIHKIHSLSEEPGGYLLLNDKKLKIFSVSSFDNVQNEAIGSLSVLKKKLLLQVKGGHIVLEKVQLEGKKRMSGLDFVSGAHLLGSEILK